MISAFALLLFGNWRATNETRKKKKRENGRGKRTYKAEERGELVEQAIYVYRTTGDVK